MVSEVDVLIIGGGPAGLTAASTLGRQLQTCIIFDDETYRNKLSNDMHMVLTAENEGPEGFRTKAREELVHKYETISYERTHIIKITKMDGVFEAEDGKGSKWQGKKLILATGVEDVFPAIKGYAERWAVAIYHCFFCKGFEDRGAESSGILAVDMLTNINFAMHAARAATQFSKKVVVYTNGEEALAAQFAEAFAGAPAFSTDSRKIKELTKGPSGGQIVLHFEEGTEKTEAFLGHAPFTKAKGPFVEQLHLEATQSGDLVVSPPFAQTKVKGVFAAGDNSTPLKAAATAMYTGGLAGSGASAQLLAEKLGHTSTF